MNPWREGIPFWPLNKYSKYSTLNKYSTSQAIKYDSKRKSSPTSNLPMIISSSFKLSTIILLSLSQDKTCFQKTEDILQEKSKCSMDLTSVWQKAHLSDSAISKRKSFSFVNTIRFNILNWNSLSFVSNVVRKDSR